MPGGCTVMERTGGRRFRCRYAAVTDVSTGPAPLPVSTARHCRYLAFGLAMAAPSVGNEFVDHALQVSSGGSVLPLRVASSMRLPWGTVPRQLNPPQVETICASLGSDSKVPRDACSEETRNSFPGFAVAK